MLYKIRISWILPDEHARYSRLMQSPLGKHFIYSFRSCESHVLGIYVHPLYEYLDQDTRNHLMQSPLGKDFIYSIRSCESYVLRIYVPPLYEYLDEDPRKSPHADATREA